MGQRRQSARSAGWKPARGLKSRPTKEGRRSGQAALEFALLYAGVILPLTFMTLFVAQMLWVWHSAIEFTRDGARYAATHCWHPDGSNVTAYMTSHVPRMIDMDQFMSGGAAITVEYYRRDPSTGLLGEFTCDAGECNPLCVPDTVTVRVSNYEFRRFFTTYLRLSPVVLPDFRASMAMGGGGCDETGNCATE
jgi:hypothetical protein